MHNRQIIVKKSIKNEKGHIVLFRKTLWVSQSAQDSQSPRATRAHLFISLRNARSCLRPVTPPTNIFVIKPSPLNRPRIYSASSPLSHSPSSASNTRKEKNLCHGDIETLYATSTERLMLSSRVRVL